MAKQLPQVAQNTTCGECHHFHEVAQRTDSKTGKVYVADSLGRCATKSIFPAHDPAENPYPPEAQRAEPGARGKIHVVRREEAHLGCADFRPRAQSPVQ